MSQKRVFVPWFGKEKSPLVQLKLLGLGFHHKAHLHSTPNKASLWAQISREFSSMPEFAEYTPVGSQQIGLKFKEIVEKVTAALESGDDWESGRAHADEVMDLVRVIVNEINSEKELQPPMTPSTSNSILDKIGDEILLNSFQNARKRHSSEPSISVSSPPDDHSSSSSSYLSPLSSSQSNSTSPSSFHSPPAEVTGPKQKKQRIQQQSKQIPFEERVLGFLEHRDSPIPQLQAPLSHLPAAFQAIETLLQQGNLSTEGAASAIDLLSDNLTIEKVATMPESLLSLWFLSKGIQ
jgi:hypothetical protein